MYYVDMLLEPRNLPRTILVLIILALSFLSPVISNVQTVKAQELSVDVIVYPPSITTDKDKLAAVYSLIEQMRTEHNRLGETARSDWGWSTIN